MGIQKQQKCKRYRIDYFFQLVSLIFFIALFSMIGCNKLEENSGKLEIMGKVYLLDFLDITCCDCPGTYCYNFFEFGSSEAKISVRFSIQNIGHGDIPIGTFKIGGSTTKPILSDIYFHFGKDGTAGICEDEATLKISKPKGNLNYTLKGKMRFGEELCDFKLTYRM
jgi:hypothetical protein